MNNKGFTLIELLATIAVLAIISTVTIVSVTSSYQKSKEKAEEAFKKQLEGYVDDYITMYGSKLDFDNGILQKKCYIDKEQHDAELCEEITLKKAEREYINDGNDDNDKNLNMNIKYITDMFSSKDVFNPNTNIMCDASNTTLTIYRDKDFVYCFTIKPNGVSSCINETISTCENMYKPGNCTNVDSNGYCTFK